MDSEHKAWMLSILGSAAALVLILWAALWTSQVNRRAEVEGGHLYIRELRVEGPAAERLIEALTETLAIEEAE